MASRDTSDQALIEAAAAGDKAALGTLLGRYQHDAVRIAVIALGSTQEADDVVQEAFIKLQRALVGFRAGAPFRPWLYRIVVNTARNRQRSQSRRAKLAVRVAALGPAVPRSEGPAEEAAIAAAERQRMVTAINRLGIDDRVILTYRWYDQLTEAEIATALDCPPGTVKSRLHRAMGRLRSELESGAASGPTRVGEVER